MTVNFNAMMVDMTANVAVPWSCSQGNMMTAMTSTSYPSVPKDYVVFIH